MKYLNGFILCCVLLVSISLTGTSLAGNPNRVTIQGDLNATTLCTSNPTSQGVAVATFESEEECNSYVGALVLGAPKGYSYSNCTSSSYCMTFNTPFVGGFAGFNLIAFAATCIYGADLEFSSNETCKAALEASDISCQTSGSYPAPACLGSVLKINGCGTEAGGPDSGLFTMLLNTLPAFSLLPTEEGHC